jgi:MFS family permease
VAFDPHDAAAPRGLGEPAPQPVTPRQVWLVLLLMMAVILAFADRSLLSILVDPIKTDLKINDVQASLLMGLSFSVIYSFAALPFGALADRVDRRRLISLAILAWSVATIFSGFAHSFWQLFVGRMGLGVAEAALGPAAFSLVRDSFAPGQRGRAFATFQASHLLGAGSALLFGGTLLGLALAGRFAAIPVFGSFHPWQQVMIALGLLGLPVAALTLTIQEPPRPALAAGARRSNFGDAWRFIMDNKAICIPFWIGIGLFTMAQGGMTGWTAMAVHRTWDIAIPAVGKTLGPIQMGMALIGSFTLGSVLDMTTKRGLPDAPVLVGGVSLSLAAVAALSQLFIPTLQGAMIAYVVLLFFFAANSISGSAGLALIAPPHLAGKLQAIIGLAINLMGLATGATVVALVSTHLFHGPRALHDGLATVVAIDFTMGVAMFALVARALRRRQARAAAAAAPALAQGAAPQASSL